MDLIVSVISDLILIIFNLSFYRKLTPLKKENTLCRTLMYGGCFLIVAAYIVAHYLFHIPYAAASFACMTVPSFILFFCLSKFKNSRFIVTFCFVDTVTYIIAFCSKIAMILAAPYGGPISCILLFVICITTYMVLRPYCDRYRNLMEHVAKGWGAMAVSTIFIYILLSFSAMYPTPIITRLEYLPIYSFLCVTVLTFYGVFIILIMQKAKLTRMNDLLQRQQHWHEMAYVDELTQLANHAAYSARTAELENMEPHEIPCSVIILDIDNFKHINDTYGHQVGNEVLQKTAQYFKATFPEEHFKFYRMGGDEFVAIVTHLSSEQVQNAVKHINCVTLKYKPSCTYSCGYADVDFSQSNAFQKAFITADKSMYAVKGSKKTEPVR